ncbi:MAG: monovalent cation/H(+) antiporter subunit G [Syntrophobacterales bacterium]|jgi:multicomponent Na+:H+ antiporter subunit G|nr:MAG: monovalent cation/H(+) antiporter subunit G [Syntrophobacterales bacterium]
MSIITIVSIVFIVGGLFFFTTATVGLLRFPDFFTRLHATGKGDTLAVFLSLVGLALYEGFSLTGLKIVVIAIFMFIAQPTATHAISKAGLRFGLKPWTREENKK